MPEEGNGLRDTIEQSRCRERSDDEQKAIDAYNRRKTFLRVTSEEIARLSISRYLLEE